MNATANTVTLDYLSGFGNEFATEALPGALPEGRNSPQKPPLGLYTEQFSGSAFTMRRKEQRRSWLYRIRPSAAHAKFKQIERGSLTGTLAEPNPNRLRWDAFLLPTQPTDFVAGLIAVAANEGMSAHIYVANTSMDRVFYNADGELLIVPQLGRLRLATECGRIDLAPREVAVIPRG